MTPAATVSIWVVDDDASVRTGLSRLLMSLDCVCLSCASGEELLQRLQSGRPDAMLLDVHMPGLSGPEVLDEMNRRGFAVPTLMMTGVERDQTREACVAAGAFDLVVKPVGASVIDTLLAHIGHRPLQPQG